VKLGLENKRSLYALIVLGVVALYGVYSQFSDSSPSPSPKTLAVQPPTYSDSAAEGARTAPRSRVRSEEWHPVVHPKSKEDEINPATVDPTLHLELLAKVQASKPAGADRNLFEFGAKPKEVAMLKGPEPVVTGPKRMGPPELPPLPPPPGPPPPPPLPALDAKYYGFASPAKSGRRRGFFMDGENILIKAEGEMLIGHYKIVKLEAGSVVVEDMDSKRTRTLQMVEDAG
jgi:hypothetical protein